MIVKGQNLVQQTLKIDDNFSEIDIDIGIWFIFNKDRIYLK
jgi:hypothetical protein